MLRKNICRILNHLVSLSSIVLHFHYSCFLSSISLFKCVLRYLSLCLRHSIICYFYILTFRNSFIFLIFFPYILLTILCRFDFKNFSFGTFFFPFPFFFRHQLPFIRSSFLFSLIDLSCSSKVYVCRLSSFQFHTRPTNSCVATADPVYP